MMVKMKRLKEKLKQWDWDVFGNVDLNVQITHTLEGV